jgi:rare lipoprotein A (peptidoglycan hydrolase)
MAAGAAAAPAGAQEQQPAALTVAARHHVLSGGLVPVRGVLASGESGRAVVVQVRTRRGWRTVDRTRTSDGGRIRAYWRAGSPGRYAMRARVRAKGTAPGASRRVRGRVHVYRKAPASWYGPGFYGRRTACGRTMSPGVLGVAHKTLPCGTRVTLRYRGRSVTVPVIDRGPYAGGRVYDLTAATKRRLRFGSTGTVLATR